LKEGRVATATSPLAWLPSIDGQIIRGNVQTILEYHIFCPLMEERWMRTLDVPYPLNHQCHWGIFFKALSTHPSGGYFTLIKYHTHLLPVGKNLLRWKHSQNGTCPGCGEFEDHDHLMQCRNHDMHDTFEHQCHEIETWLTQTTSESIRQSVMNLLHHFRSSDDTPQMSHLPLEALQQRLGRRAFFAGLWHTSWINLQDIFHQDNRIQRSARQWILHLLRQIQMLPIHMWRTRNAILHSNNNNTVNQAHNAELDQIVDAIFNPRMMAHCNNIYFSKHDKDKVKKMKIRRKTNRITGAQLILTKYK
jgi:hypothetical protein